MMLIFLCISFWQLITHWLGTFLYNIGLLFIFCIFFHLHLCLISSSSLRAQSSIFFFLAALGLGCCKWAFSGCSEWASLAVVSLVAELSSRVLPSVVTARGSVVVVCQLSCPGSGIEPMSPALAGGFLNTGPPRKSDLWHSLLFSAPCLLVIASL